MSWIQFFIYGKCLISFICFLDNFIKTIFPMQMNIFIAGYIGLVVY